MSLSDFIGDALTRVRNAQSARHERVVLPYSKIVLSVMNVLLEEGYVKTVEKKTNERGFGELEVELKYMDGRPVIQQLRRISTPGRRVYSSIKDLPLVFNGLGVTILSTNAGVMSDVHARKKGVGGEVICTVF